MAIVAFTVYTDKDASERCNTYVADGHGDEPVERTNRYIVGEHSGGSICCGYNCPGHPLLATDFMEALGRNYDMRHVLNPNRKKGKVTHVQIYVSPSEEDHVPPEERMELTRELIERTALREFASIYIAHNNTSNGHCHISLCPYSLDGTHKLCMNNKLLYDLRREMDRICVEHGYSIVEARELWGDKAYREWFLDIKAKGIVTIHPPKERVENYHNFEKKRARDYSRSKRDQRKRKEEREAFFREATSGYSPEKEAFFFTSDFLYHPEDPTQPLRIKRITEEGETRCELELRAAALGAWAYHGSKILEKRAVKGTEKLQRRMQGLMHRAFATKQLVTELDIRTQEELVFHMKECGQDIGTLKRRLPKVEAELEELKPLARAVERWEGKKDPDAWSFLERHGKVCFRDIEEVKEKHTILLSQKERILVLLEERSKEYRRLKEAEKALNPLICREEWEAYLTALFSKNVVERAKWITEEFLEEQIYELGQLLGVPEETLDRYIIEVKESPDVIRSREFRSYRKRILTAQETERQGYEQYYERIAGVEELWYLRNKLAGFGLLGFLLSILVETLAEMQESTTKMELSIALWEAGMEKWYAERMRRKSCWIEPYYPEVDDNSQRESQRIATHIQKLVTEIAEFDKEKNQARLSEIVLSEDRTVSENLERV